MLGSVEVWVEVASFCEEVMSRKEEAERERMDDPLAPPHRRRRRGQRRRQYEFLQPGGGQWAGGVGTLPPTLHRAPPASDGNDRALPVVPHTPLASPARDTEPWNEAHQERIELLKARVLELNRQLGALAAGWRHGPLSLHMNLALPSTLNTLTTTPSNATVLRSQNRMLAEEVNRKNERITVLEREKSALIRELLLQRNRTKLMESFS